MLGRWEFALAFPPLCYFPLHNGCTASNHVLHNYCGGERSSALLITRDIQSLTLLHSFVLSLSPSRLGVSGGVSLFNYIAAALAVREKNPEYPLVEWKRKTAIKDMTSYIAA